MPRSMPRRHNRAVLAALGLAIGACSDAPSPLAPTERAAGAPVLARSVQVASAPAPDPASARYEIDFMQTMIDHHEMAIMMAQACVDKATQGELVHDGALLQLCQNIVSTQMSEMRQMQGWLKSWYGIAYQPTMKPGDMKMMDRLAALTGADYEVEFLEMMLKHHAKAVKEGERCLERAYHSELKTLCQNIVSAQTREIALMQSWLCQWYGKCKAR